MIWDVAGQEPYKALQEDGLYDFFMETLNKQKVNLKIPVYRGTVRHSELKVGETFRYNYPSSWSVDYKVASGFGTANDPKSIVLSFTSTTPVKEIYNPYNSNNENEIILAPMLLKVTKITPRKKDKPAIFSGDYTNPK